MVRSLSILSVLGPAAILGFLGTPAPVLAEDQPFLRGDVNQDGVISVSDMIFIQRWLIYDEIVIACTDAADVNDDESVEVTDMVLIGNYLFRNPGWTDAPSSPYPEVGADPPDAEEGRPYMGCVEYHAMPAETSADSVRVGDITAAPGQKIKIPIYLTNKKTVDAVQLAIEYDPNLLQIESGKRNVISFVGTYFDQFIGNTYHIITPDTMEGEFYFDEYHPCAWVDAYPESGLFTLWVCGDLIYKDFAITPGQDTIVAFISATVSPEAPPDSTIVLTPTNGQAGEGFGPFHMRNELTYNGDARYLSLIPQTLPGRIGVVGDITFFFIRGDANEDHTVDISDPVFILSYLYQAGVSPRNLDAADADDNGAVEITDAVVILSQIFLGTQGIQPPFPLAGVDPTPDSIGL